MDKNVNLFEQVLSNFETNDKIASIINENLEPIWLTKNYLIHKAKQLAYLIRNTIKSTGDAQLRILAITSASEESLIFFLSSSYLSAHHCIVFESLSLQAIQDRIDIFKPDCILYRSKNSYLTALVNDLDYPANLILSLSSDELKDTPLISAESSEYKPSDSLFTLFTSGTTGKPKGIVHSCKSYIEFAKETTSRYFRLNTSSVMFTATDAGWINGHTYAIYGPLLLGSRTVLCENLELLDTPLVVYQLIRDLNVTCFYTSVTMLRLLKSNISEYQLKRDSNLELLGSCGEPLADDVARWALNFFTPSESYVVNTYFQTETGGILIAPLKNDQPLDDYSTVGQVKNTGLVLASQIYTQKELEQNQLDPSEVLMTKKWDGLFQQVIADRHTNYFTPEGHFRLFDIGRLDESGYLFIGGRSDDVINVMGHRISCSEIESVALKCSQVQDACVVARPNEMTGQEPILFLKTNTNQFTVDAIASINTLIVSTLSEYHLPTKTIVIEDLPKTKSGKIMRRLMRDALSNNWNIDKNVDLSTLVNPDSFLSALKTLSSDNQLNQQEKSFLVPTVDDSIVDVLLISAIVASFNHLSISFKINDHDLECDHCFLESNLLDIKKLVSEFYDVHRDVSAIITVRFANGPTSILSIFVDGTSGLLKSNVVPLTQDSTQEQLLQQIIASLKDHFFDSTTSSPSIANLSPLSRSLDSQLGHTQLPCMSCGLGYLQKIREFGSSNCFLLPVLKENGIQDHICNYCLRGF